MSEEKSTSETENSSDNQAPVVQAATPQAQAPKPAPVERKAGSSLPVIVVGLIAFAALGASGYNWHLAQQSQVTTKAQLAVADQAAKQQAERLAAMTERLNRSEQARQESESRLAALDNRLNQQRAMLNTLSTTDRDDWLLAEAEYLMKLANQRVLMGQDVRGALELLKAADEILVGLKDSGLFAVRRALADDMAALHTASKLDIEGLYLELGGLAKQAAALRLFKMPSIEFSQPEAMPSDAGWQARAERGFAAAAERLSSYVQIKRRDEKYEPILAPEYEGAVRQNVQLMFEQAQMSLLAGNERLYRDSLEKLSQWLASYYRLDQHATTSLVAQVEKLKGRDIVVQLPDISGSQNALKYYVERRHELPQRPEAEGEQGVES